VEREGKVRKGKEERGGRGEGKRGIASSEQGRQLSNTGTAFTNFSQTLSLISSSSPD